MALFKILRGSSENFTTDLTQSNVSPAFHDGYCYFIVDTGLFYVDYENNGNKYRIPLNAGDAKTLLGATLEHDVLRDSEVEIPSSALLYAVKNTIEENISSLEARKANKITGLPNQLVGFDDEGNFIAKDNNSLTLKNLTATLPSSANWSSVTYNNNLFVAVTSDSDKVALSDDGVTWSESTLPWSANWMPVIYGNSKFVTIASNSNKVAYSDNGINWNYSTLPSSANWLPVVYGNEKFVTIAADCSKALYSNDGIVWNTTTPPSGPPSNALSNIAYGNGVFTVASSKYSGMTFYSNDGITWNYGFGTSHRAKYIVYVNDIFIANVDLINSREILYSNDGINWEYTDFPTNSADWLPAAYGNNRFVILASNSNRAVYSDNGIDWSVTTLPSSANWLPVVYSDGKFVTIAANSNKAIYSDDGITWYETTLPQSANWLPVVYGNGKFVTIAADSNNVAVSIDGITWINDIGCYVYQNDENVTETLKRAVGNATNIQIITWEADD